MLSLESIVVIWKHGSQSMIPSVPFPLATTHHCHQLMFAQAEALRSSLHELEGLLKEYSPLMSGSTEKSVDRAIKYGAVFAEVSSLTSHIHKERA